MKIVDCPRWQVFGSLVLASLMGGTSFVEAQAFHPQVTKLHGRGPGLREDYYFGQAAAVSDRHLLLGEPSSDDANTGAGAAHLFDAVTGRYLRRLTAADADPEDHFGWAVAVAGNWALISAPFDDAKGNMTGAAYVFDTRTGRQVAKLTAPDAAPEDQFGSSVAASGNLCVVGAIGDDDKGPWSGSAYLFELPSDTFPSGRFVKKLIAGDGQADDVFGHSVAISGNGVVVGAFGDSHALGDEAGSAYVFDTGPSTQFKKLIGVDTTANDNLGYRVALDGYYALVSAPGDDDLGSNSGSAYVFDIRTGVQITKFTALDGTINNGLGQSVAISGHLALVGVPFDDDKGIHSGSAYLFDTVTGKQISKLTAYDGAAGTQFGVAVALNANTALVGANTDDDLISNAGAAYLFRPLASPLPLTLAAARGSQGPGTVEASFSRFGPDVFLNPDGEVSLTAQLTGPGASGGRAFGAWNNLAPGRSLDLALRGRDDIGGARIASVTGTVSNHPNEALVHTVLTGTGVTPANNRCLWRDDGAAVSKVLRTGDNPGNIFNGGRLQAMTQVAHASVDSIAVAGQLARGSGSGMGEKLVTASNDSVVFSMTHNGANTGELYREGNPESSGTMVPGTLGQLLGRVAQSRSSLWVVVPSWWIPDGGGAPFQKLYEQVSNSPLSLKAVQGGNAPGTGMLAAQYRSFLGESLSESGWAAWRATLTGPTVTIADNEGLWHEKNLLVVRKGQQLNAGDEPGVRVSRILQFWPSSGFLRVFFLARLSGPGVTAANDVALYVWHYNGGMPVVDRLMREGDFTSAQDGSRIGTIQRVDVTPGTSSQYVVLASLTGASRTNQALFTGRGDQGTVLSGKHLRLPGLQLRKGILYTSPNTVPRTLRSILLPATTDATGAGGKGFGQVINPDGHVVVNLQFDNGAQEILSGVP